MKQTNLDERQRLALLQIESRGFWLVWWGLIAAIALQMMLGPDLWRMLPEWLIFMTMNLYMLMQCMRQNIWDRRLKPTPKTNLFIALVSGAVVGVACLGMLAHMQRKLTLFGCGVALAAAVFTALVCFIILQLCAAKYKRDREAMENAPEE